MKHDRHLTSLPWGDYELIDSGENYKLERFGDVILARPETQAIWKKNKPELWSTAHSTFVFEDKKGSWKTKKSVPASWQMSWRDAKFLARLTSFKHTGIFPEQAPNWEWVADRVKSLGKRQELAKNSGTFSQQASAVSVLNLFGYTGIASVVTAQSGAFVTHVDASKQSLDWAHENARLSNVSDDSIRWILDDALAFVKREVRRGAKYDGIILDPPAFGRGAKGEVWKIEENFSTLLESLKEILSDTSGSFFLLNGYAAGYASRSFSQAVESAFGDVDGEAGELYIKESTSTRVVPAGIYVRFAR